MGRDGWRAGSREREGRRECGSAGQIRLRGFFFFSKHEIVSVLLKCMFEVGVQLNTSCLKKTDARVAQEMRERPQRGRGEGVEGRGERKGSMRKLRINSERGMYGTSMRL